jgi:hypothetical protein
MAICPSCYSFQAEGAERCTRCGQSLERDLGDLGMELLEAVERPRESFRPVELVLLAAAIPVAWGLIRAGVGAETQSRYVTLSLVYPLLGGVALGGWMRMMLVRARGYEGPDITSWWVAAAPTLLPPILWLLRVLDREHAIAGVLLWTVLLHVVLCLSRMLALARSLHTRRLGLGPLGGLLCALWLVAHGVQLLLLLPW